MKDIIAGIISAAVALIICVGTLAYIAIDEYNVATQPHGTPVVYDYGNEAAN